METNKDQPLEKFIGKIVHEDGKLEPSSKFTQEVMSKISASGVTHSKLNYTPLISRWAWGVLGFVLLGIIAVSTFMKVESSISWLRLEEIKLPISFDLLSVLPDSLDTNVFAYSMMALVVCLYIQLYAIKKFHHRKLVL